MTSFTFNTAASVRFGFGMSHDPVHVAPPGLGKRVLLLTDAGMIATGLVDRVVGALRQAGVDVCVFSDIVADPPEAVVLAATQLAIDRQVSGIVGFGGGSSLDAAKLVAVLSKQEQTLSEMYGVGKVTSGRLPLVLIPTTSGTGSEVTPVSIITTGNTEKMGVVSPVLLPDVAILDPELTIGLPAHVTAATGIDAMVHAIEAFASRSVNNNPLSKLLAKEALSLMGAALETAVLDGGNLKARSDMLLGASLAGQAFANSPVAAVHALAYPIGGHYKVPHGLSNALVLPHVLRFNAQNHADVYAQLASHAFPQITERPFDERAMAFADELAALSARCGLPQTLREMSIEAEALPLLARDAMKQTRLLVNNPCDLTYDDVLAIYQRAY